jgi:uncharacterized membrane protein
MRRSLLPAVLSLSLLLSAIATTYAASYTFTTIDVPGSISTVTTGINDSGRIVGRFRDAAGIGHGILIDGTTITTIDVPDAVETTEANGINTAGQIVGVFYDAAHRLEVISIYSYRASEAKRSAGLQHLCRNGSFTRPFGHL